MDVILILLLFALLLWVAPVLVIASSDKTSGLEKVLWLIAVIFISWFAWILYAVLAPVKSLHLKPQTQNKLPGNDNHP